MPSVPDDDANDYNRLLEAAILELRMRIRYEDDVTIDEVHDLLDAIHNIPKMLRNSCDRNVYQNIDADLAEYDRKWQGKGDAKLRRSLITCLQEVRAGKYDHR